jgi:hypothetical protein
MCGKSYMELVQGARLSQNDLAARLQLEKSTVSRLVGIWRIVAGLRVLVPHGMAARELHFTDTRQQMAADLAKTRRAKFAPVFIAIPEAEHATVLESLHMLVEATGANQ